MLAFGAVRCPRSAERPEGRSSDSIDRSKRTFSLHVRTQAHYVRKFVMPTKRLPPQPNLVHLKHQAADLLEAHRTRVPQALHRLREFHPRMRGRADAAIADANLKLSDAYLAIAHEYGFPSWPKLKAFVEHGNAAVLALPAHERIGDPEFRRAVELVDAGDTEGLRAHLNLHPDLVRRRVTLYGGNYFQTPTLLEFIAENPTRRGTLPPNIADIARVILDAGGRADRSSLDSTLGLAASSRVAREWGVQNALIDILCEYGGDPNVGVLPALLYAEFAAVDRLLTRGAAMTLISAAALGRTDELRRLLSGASDDERRLALALAADLQEASPERQHQRSPGVFRGYWEIGWSRLMAVVTMRFCSVMCAAG